MFFNKRYNLIYGKYVRKLLEANNENYVVVKFLHSFKVNYDQIINKLLGNRSY